MRHIRTIASVLAALFGGGVIAAVAGHGVIATILLVCGAVGGAVVALVNARLETLASRERSADAERRRVGLLATTVHGVRDQVPRLRELSAYDLGADHEAISVIQCGEDSENLYLPRDRDKDLSHALDEAFTMGRPRMVVLRGPSKAGKSRTLYEAVSRDGRLMDAVVLRPRDADALTRLLEPEGRPALPATPVVIWLDDLERYVQAGHRGIHPMALEAFGVWSSRVIVVATGGGKGSDQVASTGLAVPIEELYSHPLVRVIPLTSEFSDRERAEARARYAPEVADRIVEHGIAEYLVAAPALARKLEEERAKPGAPTCPEGAALVWAVIDWARTGMAAPLPTDLLRTLWPLYLHGQQPTDECFARALAWATAPVYRSIALVQGDGSYEPYDWIVLHAIQRIQRPINPHAWDLILASVDPDAAFDLGVMAGAWQDRARSIHAFTRAKDAPDPRTAALAAFNLGVGLQEDSDLDGARAAWERAIQSGYEDLVGKGLFNLGLLGEEQGDLNCACSTYRRAIESGHDEAVAKASINLGRLLKEQGDVDGAKAAWDRSLASAPADYVPRVAVHLGALLAEQGEFDAARSVYQRAVDSDDVDKAAEAMVDVGLLSEGQDDLAEAVLAYQRVIESGHADQAPRAAYRLGLVLKRQGDARGARAAYDQAISSGDEHFAPLAAFNLGVLLTEQNDLHGARVALQQAIESGHEEVSPKAAVNLAMLLLVAGDPDAARKALGRACSASDQTVASVAAALLAHLDSTD
jgi:tetratricopeptide (TPR) repeat protein